MPVTPSQGGSRPLGVRQDEEVGRVVSSSVSARNWCYLCERIERVEKGEAVEIANVHAVLMHVVENMVGWQKRISEYPTLSPTVVPCALFTKAVASCRCLIFHSFFKEGLLELSVASSSVFRFLFLASQASSS